MTSNKLVHYVIRLNGSLPPAVVSGEEPIHLSIYLPAPTRATTLSPTSLSSLFPLPILPCLTSPSQLSSEEGIIATNEQFYTSEGSPAPFEEVAPPSPTVAASEEALSEGPTEVEEEPPVAQDTIQLPKNLEVGGWVNLQRNLVNHIIRRIHNDPEFFPALALQFEGENTIFGEDRRALEGLHIVCRQLERDTIEQVAAAEAQGVADTWDKYFEDTHRRADILQAYDHVL